MLSAALCPTHRQQASAAERDRQLDREIIQEIGRESEITGSAKGHEGDQVAKDAFSGRKLR